MIGAGAAQRHVAACRCDGAQEGAGLDAVGNDRMRPGRGMQPLHALNADTVSAVAFDAGAHGDQHFGQIGDFGLLRGIFQDGLAAGQRGGHQQVFGAGDRHHVGGDAGTAQSAFRSAGDDVAVLDADVGPHRL